MAPQFSNLLASVDKLAGRRVLCVGDVILDRFIYGQIDRMSREAPIPVVLEQKATSMLGGLGNVVRNIVSMGSQVDLIGVIGSDEAGQQLAEELERLGSVTAHLIKDKNRPTTVKTRFIAGNQQIFRTDREIYRALPTEIVEEIVSKAAWMIGNVDLVVLSDYGQGALKGKVAAEIIKLAKIHKKLVLVDTKIAELERYKGASYFFPNRAELSESAGIPLDTSEKIEKAALALIKRYDLTGVMAKLGAEGVCLVPKDEKPRYFKSIAREVFEVSGAGDTVLATMALALAGGVSAADSAALANLAGSFVVGKIGTAAITREELSREITRDITSEYQDKIMTADQAADLAVRYRQHGYKIGFTNGYFDLLHPGNISCIRQARAACDKLFIGLNSDASILRTKGKRPPVQDEGARAMVLASLADVDGIVIFDEETPLNIVKTIHPDVFVKGANYSLDRLPEAQAVKEWGGEVLFVELMPGFAATTIAAKQKEEKTGS